MILETRVIPARPAELFPGCRVLRGPGSRSGCGARRVVLGAAARERSCGGPWPGTSAPNPAASGEAVPEGSICVHSGPYGTVLCTAHSRGTALRVSLAYLFGSAATQALKRGLGTAADTPRPDTACFRLRGTGAAGRLKATPKCRVSTRHPGPVRIRASPVTVMIANGCARSISPAQTGYGQASSPFALGCQRHADATSMRVGWGFSRP